MKISITGRNEEAEAWIQHGILIGNIPLSAIEVSRLGTPPELSEMFVERILRFVSWAPAWDGQDASTVAVDATKRAVLIARRSLRYGPEPFVAPAADGSLLLQWDFPDGSSVECFVTSDGFDHISLTDDSGQVREVPVKSEDDLMSFLSRHSTLVSSCPVVDRQSRFNWSSFPLEDD